MAIITAGTGGTITANTIEGQIWQLIHLIQNGERIDSASSERFTFIKDDSFIMSGNWSLPARLVRDAATGLFSDSVAAFAPGAIPFTAGTGGTIRSTTLGQYFLDCVKYAMVWQAQATKNPQALQRFTLLFNAGNLEYSGTFLSPYTTVLGAGGTITETATEWLLT